MKSAIAITTEIDDIHLAAEELVTQIRGRIEPAQNSIAIAICDADVDVAGLSRLVNAELGVDVVGLTTVATLERNRGYSDMGVLLSFLTADDVSFAAGYTGALSMDNLVPEVKEAYKKARCAVPEEPKLILTFAPYIADLTADSYVDALNEASGGVPVFGGVANDHHDLLYQRTIINGQASTDSLVFLLISGNIKPVFAMEHHFGTKVEKKGKITKSTRNFIERIGDQTLKEYVSSIIPVPDEELVLFHFLSTPFVMELPDYEDYEEAVVRALSTVDHQTGAGGFLSNMPEGSTICINVFQRENIKESCRGTLSGIVERMKRNSDYDYSMVFISSCSARHILMGNAKNMESDIIGEKLSSFPQSLNLAGYYSLGEMCPTGIKKDGRAKNRYHNFSFAVCAI